MQRACASVAAVTADLKQHYREVLTASPGYGRDRRMTRAVDRLGQLVKELQDAVVMLEIRLAETTGSEAGDMLQDGRERSMFAGGPRCG
jgi:hypothetical protein